MKKWNYETHSYDDYNEPDNWYIPLQIEDMEKKIHCSSCGKEVVYGETYTSQEIYTNNGLWGYPVCEECHKKETKKREKYKKKNL